MSCQQAVLQSHCNRCGSETLPHQRPVHQSCQVSSRHTRRLTGVLPALLGQRIDATRSRPPAQTTGRASTCQPRQRRPPVHWPICVMGSDAQAGRSRHANGRQTHQLLLVCRVGDRWWCQPRESTCRRSLPSPQGRQCLRSCPDRSPCQAWCIVSDARQTGNSPDAPVSHPSR